MQPIVVTGAAGFIGARFVASCNARGIPVVSVDRADYFTARPEHQQIDFGTIIDTDQLLGWLATERPALRGIVHMGACSDTTERDTEFLRRVNIEYSQHLWRHATTHTLPFVYASSAATYGDGSLGYDDDVALMPQLRPLNAYGESKRLFDLWALDEAHHGRTPRGFWGFKFFNVFGFGERHKGRMASVALHAFDQIRATGRVRLFKSHKPGFADGHQVRDFVFVDDVVAVLHAAHEGRLPNGIYNLGTGHGRTFLDLARAVFAALGAPEQIDFIDMPLDLRDCYQYFTEARMERLRAAGYQTPFTSLEDACRRYVSQLLATA